MKTRFSHEEIQQFLQNTKGAKPDSVTQLQEGHISQAYCFDTTEGDKRVLRIADKEDDFRADEYAARTFGTALLVPKLLEIGNFGDDAFYCISEYAPGITTDRLDESSMEHALPSIQDALAAIFQHDISSTTGYKHPDLTTGNASYTTWKEAVSNDLERRGKNAFQVNASNIDLDPVLIDKFFEQYRVNLPFASEKRRLFHGDPAFDNMLVEHDNVTAVIDWAQFGYGDWVSDYARLDFWYPGLYGDIQEFASRYNLDAENIEERISLYWATNALWTIEFADAAKSDHVAQWLRDHVADKLRN